MERRKYDDSWLDKQLVISEDYDDFREGDVVTVMYVDTEDTYQPFRVSPNETETGWWIPVDYLEIGDEDVYKENGIRINASLSLYARNVTLKGQTLDDLITVLLYLKMREEGENG